ncbi:MAG: VCBS repeat-containing protein [Solirubrobacteraceae bacterium]|nr:VCBS repeat-containing protein [Solirubrobacteraceae bacterium]
MSRPLAPVHRLLIGAVLALGVAAPASASAAAPLFPSTTLLPHANASSKIDDADDVRAADVDADGDLDLAVAGVDENVGAGIFVYRNDGAGNFTFVGLVPGHSQDFVWLQVEPADVTGDGVVDLLIADGSDLVALTWPEGGAVSRDVVVSFPTPVPSAFSWDVRYQLVDLDGDDDLDVIARGGSPSLTRVYLVGAGGGAQLQWSSSTAAEQPFVVTGDLDGDDLPELVLADGASIRVISDVASNPTVSWTTGPDPTGWLRVGASLVDVDGDGHLDLITSLLRRFTTDPNATRYLRGEADGSFTSVALRPDSAQGQPINTTGDVDGDGRADLIRGIGFDPATPSGEEVSIEPVAGPRTFGGTGSAFVTGTSNGIRRLATGDLNADGRDDIVMLTTVFGWPKVALAAAPAPVSGYLKAYSPDPNPDATIGTLEDGVDYEVTVTGTFSLTWRSRYGSPSWKVCGTPDLVRRRSADAETVLARFVTPGTTCPATPSSHSLFRLDTGSGWIDPPVVTRDGDRATGRTYTYKVTGHGEPLRAMIRDTIGKDNSGGLLIEARPITH